MHPLGEKRIQIIITCIIIAFVSIALVSVYSIHLLNKAIWEKDEAPHAIDMYNQKLQYDMGISADNYESRELYTDEEYENDKIQIIKNIRNGRFDFVAIKAKDLLASYKFDDNKLTTITTLKECEVFDLENGGTTDEKITILTGIMDPELYILFFMLLDVEEQRILIDYENVQMLPGFEYDTINVTECYNSYTDQFTKIIGTTNYYKIELIYRNVKHYVYMVEDRSLKIFYINNENNNMNGFTY